MYSSEICKGNGKLSGVVTLKKLLKMKTKWFDNHMAFFIWPVHEMPFLLSLFDKILLLMLTSLL